MSFGTGYHSHARAAASTAGSLTRQSLRFVLAVTGVAAPCARLQIGDRGNQPNRSVQITNLLVVVLVVVLRQCKCAPKLALCTHQVINRPVGGAIDRLSVCLRRITHADSPSSCSRHLNRAFSSRNASNSAASFICFASNSANAFHNPDGRVTSPGS
ncbi:hypothetical protein Henu3_gp31 [Mycobacterium phage Henu3 PeY-2017]|nr:hypothetical protein Henu3_gp31 [Mycobacterium phage Henu3 PeY-2017]